MESLEENSAYMIFNVPETKMLEDEGKEKIYYQQGHPATFFFKITVRRSKYCLEIFKA